MQFSRHAFFPIGSLLLIAGVALHWPMLAQGHAMGNHLAGMAMDPAMIGGMLAIVGGAALASFGVLRTGADAMTTEPPSFEAPADTPLNRWHGGLLAVLVLGLIIDVMKPATLGFVLPGLAREYAIPRATAALLPLVALIGTVAGSFLWGLMADRFGRRASIIVSTILFVSTSVCGAMPSFGWNLAMCFLMGASAGGMLPVVYTLLAEILPARHRSGLLVLIGGTGLIGGYLAASLSAYLFEPSFGWRVLWLQGFPTGILLLALARFIPESPRFLFAQGRQAELDEVKRKFGLVEMPAAPIHHSDPAAHSARRLTIALAIAALSWSLVNFGLLLWLPSELQARGLSASVASGLISRSALIAIPAVMIAAWSYSRWSSKWTLVASILLTLVGMAGLLLPIVVAGWDGLAVAVIATIIIGTNVTIATLLPYSAETSPERVRGRATGLVAGSSKLGGVAVQSFALLGLLPTLGQAALGLIVPLALSAGLVAWAGHETRGRRLND